MNENDIKRKMLQKKLQEQQRMAAEENQTAFHQAAAQQMMQQQMLKEQLDILKKITSQILEPKARERLSNLKLVKPDMALQLEVYLVQLYQAGQLRGKVTEAQLIAILSKLGGPKKDFKIKRK
jgi:programmed cell death protein 5